MLFARTIFEMTTPVISAVGHETDFTIADFVADKRVPTPSAAAEIAVPDIKELMLSLDDTALRVEKSTRRILDSKKRELDLIKRAAVLNDARAIFEERYTNLSDFSRRLQSAITGSISEKRASLAILSGKADALSPLSVLSRGYGIIEKNGKSVKSTVDLTVGDEVRITLSSGKVDAQITEICEVEK